MPVPKGTRFRVKTTKSGKRVRLAFKGNKVNKERATELWRFVDSGRLTEGEARDAIFNMTKGYSTPPPWLGSVLGRRSAATGTGMLGVKNTKEIARLANKYSISIGTAAAMLYLAGHDNLVEVPDAA